MDRPSRKWVPATTAIAVVAVVAGIGASIGWSGGRDRVPAAGSGVGSNALPTLPADLGSGIGVVGFGNLFRDGAGPVRLCAGVSETFDLPPSKAACGAVAVSTAGVDPSWLDQVTTSGQAFSHRVRVSGVYHQKILTVTAIEAAPLGPGFPTPQPALPCAEPVGGWRPGTGFGSYADDETASKRLDNFLHENAEAYSQLWQAHPGGAAQASMPTYSVAVVGTTGDLAQARSALSAIFPGNLCVHAVSRSSADLDRIIATLTRDGGAPTPIEAVALPVENQVRVSVVALDPATYALLQRIGVDALVIQPPLLRPAA